MGFSRHVEFAGPTGRIEAILHGRDEDRPLRVAVVCHPHPLAGGTMHTKVVHRTARTLEEAGHRVVRFNFRGVGASAGTHDRGVGEQDDARSAIDYITALHPGLPVIMAGFSFGSWVGLRVGAADPRVKALVGIALPVGMVDFDFIGECRKPKLIVHGSADTIAPFASLEALYPSIAEPKTLHRIEGADHFFTERLDEVEGAIRKFVSAL